MTLNVLDVSGYQAGIAESVLNQSDEILIVKVTEGTELSNADWKRQADFAISQGMLVGLYHFPRFGDSTEQADAFLAQTEGYWGKGVAIPILDWEEASYTQGILSYPEFALDWLARVAKKTGATPWVYSGANDAKNADSRLKAYPLWVAAYPYGTPQQGFGAQASWEWARDTVGGGLDGWTVLGWQYTGTGRLSGYAGDLDMSIFYTTRAELDQYTGITSSTQPAAVTSSTETITLQPVTGYAVTQSFGDGANLVVNGVLTNSGTGHTGIDFGCPVGTSAVALEAGTVLWADWAKNLPQTSWADRWYLVGGGYGGLSTDAGICIVIDHGSYLSTYSHMSETALNIGDKVTQGQVVGKTGATGFVSGAHLHFEVLPKPLNYQNGYYGRANPVPYFTQTVETASLAATVASEKDEFDMANIDDLFTTKRKAWGNRDLDTVIKEMDRNTWNTKKMTWRLDSLFRIGIPGRFTDGLFGGLLRKLSGYNEASQGKARQADYDKAAQTNFDA